MYNIKELDDLKIGDKVIIIIDGKPMIVTVNDVDLDDNSFIIEEGFVNVYLDRIAVLIGD